MSKPVVADNKPMVLRPAPGTYWWCACGLSGNQPHCDGSHKAGDIVPVEYSIAETRTVALCLCKQTRKPPFCDGSHGNLP